MANRTNTTRKHSSPGLYFDEQVLNYSAKSLGITTLGVVGETLRGPAFQSISVTNWKEYQKYFGGTSTKKFKGSQYPKYELPYIAKSFLEESNQLEVVRVLGLSGVNAGPAWVITATKHKLYTGYDYADYGKDPYGGDESKWSGATYDSIDDMPKAPYIDESAPAYVRVRTGYEWHTLCDACDESKVTPENTFDLTDPETIIPDANSTDLDYMKVIQMYSYKEVNAPSDTESDYITYMSFPAKADYSTPKHVKIPQGDLVYDYTFSNGTNGTMQVVSVEYTDEPECQNGKTTFTITIEEETSEFYVMSVPGNFQGIPLSVYNDEGIIEDLTITIGEEHEVEYAYYDLDNTAYCYEKVAIYNYYQKVWKNNIQLAEEDYCEGNRNNMVVAVLRSRGQHKKAAFVRTPTESDIDNGICEDIYSYDGIEYFAKNVYLEPSKSLKLGSSCNPGFSATTGDFTIDSYNYGTFTIVVETNIGETKRYSVSLNAGEKNYIYNVIGGYPEEGDAEIYVEELYDVALKQLVEAGLLNSINSEVVKYPNVSIVPKFADVNDILTESVLTRNYKGKRYLYSNEFSNNIPVRYSEDGGNTWIEGTGLNGVIYTVKEALNRTTGKKEYFYGAYTDMISYEYRALETEPEGVVWINCSQTVTDEQQNSFVDYPPFYEKVITENPEYLRITRNYDWLNDIDGVTVNGNSVEKNGEVVYDSLTTEAYNFKPFMYVVETEHTLDGTDAVTITLPEDCEFKVYSYSVEHPNLYKYEWEKVEGEENKYRSTNSIDNLPAGTYMFLIYTEKSGVYNITLKEKDGATPYTQYLPALTVKDNPETYYQKYVTDIAASTDAKKKTERLTAYDFTKDVVDNRFENCVRVVADDMYYVNINDEDVYPITLDFNNYKEQYRYSSTPWIVSEIKGSAEQVQLAKLFRFHTISDGNSSSSEIKVSIENIDPLTGKFDVIVRNFSDTDVAISPVERFMGCTLVPGTSDYIALRIGSFDESYEAVSNYISVEVIENDVTKNSIPAGFLGYPVRNYNGLGIKEGAYKYVKATGSCDGAVEMDKIPTYVSETSPILISVNGECYEREKALTTEPTQPYFKFNTTIDNDLKPKKQYFGVSDLAGIDTDVLTYKGVEAYNGVPAGLTPCFHLDSRILNGTPDENGVITEDGLTQTVSVDGVTGYTWVTVNKNEVTSEGIEPRIGSEDVMNGTIYEDKKYRKFTVAFYGGWDGWDYYRTSRSNTNEFRYKDYKGNINTVSGYGDMFSVIKNPETYDFDVTEKIINSDYYAYLAGVRKFANPKSIEINVLATPGIDYINNSQLVNEVIDMVEEERSDSVYVLTTPDKPFGASDSKEDMYSPEDVVAYLEDSDIDCNHATTYYPWVKYFDADNAEYIYLPITRDVVKSIALTDNQAWPWYAAAGWNRGLISGVGPKRKLKLGEQDTLYDGRINFVNSFGNEGDRIWGDKDLQIADNQLNRLSARRLLLRIKKLLQTACIGLIFDPNDNTCSKAVKSAVSNVLDKVKENRGITDYRIEIDDSPSVRDQLGLGVTYYIKRTPMLEWINFTSVLTPQGMEW